MAYSSYYKYQKYVTYQQQDPLPYIPITYSVDGEGTLPLRLKDECDVNCGCTGDTHDYSQDYLTFVALEDGTFRIAGDSASFTVSYSIDNGQTWNSLGGGMNTPTVQAGNTILWKANGWNSVMGDNIYYSHPFSSTGRFVARGNIMSLISGDSFSEATTIAMDGQFYGLFNGCTGITSADNLALPATTLSIDCYNSMFRGCTSLTTAPKLPATALSNRCYGSMFYGCTSLVNAPKLPATTVTEWCYSYMFKGCTSLTTAPALPALTILRYSYAWMFDGCTSLNSVTCLATDISAGFSSHNWLNGVAATGTFTKAASMNDWPSGTSGIPNDWTVVNA